MFIARPTLNNARSIGAQCRHQLHFAPNGANHLCGGRAINMLLLRSKDHGQLSMLLPQVRLAIFILTLPID